MKWRNVYVVVGRQKNVHPLQFLIKRSILYMNMQFNMVHVQLKFQVQVEGTDGVLTVDCATDDQGVYTFTVTNQSEVTMGYSVTVEFKQSVPGTMLQVAMDDNPFGYLDQNNTIRFAVDETLEPLGDNATHQLFFQVTPKALYSTVQGEASVELALDFAVIVHARQVD